MKKKKKELEHPNVYKIDSVRKFRLGTRYHTAYVTFQYGKVDFGVLAKTTEGKVLKNIQYMWIRVSL